MTGKIFKGVNAINTGGALKFPPVSPEEQRKIDICCECKKPVCKNGYCEIFKSSSMRRIERRNSDVRTNTN